MLINKLTVKNFLSLRNVSLKLGKLNVLVGPNASGKSNIVKALRTISTIVKNGPTNVVNILGVKNFKEITFQMNENITAHLSLNMNINGKKILYNLQFLAMTERGCRESFFTSISKTERSSGK
ncbi:MAG: AAA family ATPase [Candidatus Odinarchaeota archaeon]|nr:AAA family ATPase [Candidatus Odinarchaeota archaeon]